jgi:hypothetical protein
MRVVQCPCRAPSEPGFKLSCRGGLLAEDAIELLKAFYSTGNPRGNVMPSLHEIKEEVAERRVTQSRGAPSTG